MKKTFSGLSVLLLLFILTGCGFKLTAKDLIAHGGLYEVSSSYNNFILKFNNETDVTIYSASTGEKTGNKKYSIFTEKSSHNKEYVLDIDDAQLKVNTKNKNNKNTDQFVAVVYVGDTREGTVKFKRIDKQKLDNIKAKYEKKVEKEQAEKAKQKAKRKKEREEAYATIFKELKFIGSNGKGLADVSLEYEKYNNSSGSYLVDMSYQEEYGDKSVISKFDGTVSNNSEVDKLLEKYDLKIEVKNNNTLSNDNEVDVILYHNSEEVANQKVKVSGLVVPVTDLNSIENMDSIYTEINNSSRMSNYKDWNQTKYFNSKNGQLLIVYEEKIDDKEVIKDSKFYTYQLYTDGKNACAIEEDSDTISDYGKSTKYYDKKLSEYTSQGFTKI